jgi:hypothetical protein
MRVSIERRGFFVLSDYVIAVRGTELTVSSEFGTCLFLLQVFFFPFSLKQEKKKKGTATLGSATRSCGSARFIFRSKRKFAGTGIV